MQSVYTERSPLKRPSNTKGHKSQLSESFGHIRGEAPSTHEKLTRKPTQQSEVAAICLQRPTSIKTGSEVRAQNISGGSTGKLFCSLAQSFGFGGINQYTMKNVDKHRAVWFGHRTGIA